MSVSRVSVQFSAELEETKSFSHHLDILHRGPTIIGEFMCVLVSGHKQVFLEREEVQVLVKNLQDWEGI